MLITLERPYPAGPGDACGVHAGFLWEIADVEEARDYGRYVSILVHVFAEHPGYGGEGVMLTTRFLDHWYDAESIVATVIGCGSKLLRLPDIAESDSDSGLCITAQRFYDSALHIPPCEPDTYWKRPDVVFDGFIYALTLCCKLCEFAAACQEEARRGQYAD